MTAARPRKAAATPRPQSASATAREAEAEDGFLTIEQCGVTLRVPVGGKMPIKAFMRFRAGDELGGTEILLGPKQWQALMDNDPTVDDMNEIGTKLQELQGN